jgi:hypothetical protein
MMTATNIQYEPADRVQGLSAGGIGAIFLLAQKIDLIKEIDRNLHLLKVHQPYHESDHVLNIAFNIVAGGKRIEHLELRRNDEVYLNALGAQRIPDPTTAGDFSRGSDLVSSYFGCSGFIPLSPLGPSTAGELAHRLLTSPEAPRLSAHRRGNRSMKAPLQRDRPWYDSLSGCSPDASTFARIGWRRRFSTEGGT